jgi:hypothetical protein
MLRTAHAILVQVLHYVKPPRGVAMAVTEKVPAQATDTNWFVTTGPLDLEHKAKLTQKLADLQQTDPIVDWCGVSERDRQNRRVARWFQQE